MSAEAGSPTSRKGRRPFAVLGGAAAASFVLARFVVASLGIAEPSFLRYAWVPLSVAMALGTAAALRLALLHQGLGPPRARPWRAAGILLASGLVLLVLLEICFVRTVEVGPKREERQIITGWSGTLGPQAGAEQCTMGGLDDCWPERPLIFVAIGLSYLATLAGIGALAGLSLGSSVGPSGSPSSRYLDFDLKIEPLPEGRYRASVWTSEQFEAHLDFALDALSALSASGLGLADSGATRGGGQQESFDPKQVGDALFKAVFQGDVRSCFRSSVESAKRRPGVRLRLRLDSVPELAELPWEYLFDNDLKGFLATSRRTPIVRYLELPESPRQQAVETPLRVLLMTSIPEDYGELALAREEADQLRSALEPLAAQGRVTIERVHPTLAALASRLRNDEAPPVHVFHFLGHGGFDSGEQQGVLVLETEGHRGQPVLAQSFADLLKDHPSLRLAVLNACNGARAHGDDAFAGTAQSLVERGGLPAVVAMRKEVTDETACRFAAEFYRALADRLPIEACVGEARKLLAACKNQEWGTPVLYLRASDGHLFAPANEDGTAEA